MSTSKKDSPKPAKKSAPKSAAKAAPKQKPAEAVAAEEPMAEVAPAVAPEKKKAPAPAKKPSKAKPVSAKTTAVTEAAAEAHKPEVKNTPAAKKPAAAKKAEPKPEPEQEADYDELKPRKKRKGAFNPSVSAQQLQDFFSDDNTLKNAFKGLLAIAKKNNGYVTDSDIADSLPPDAAEDDDQARLFEHLHEIGVEVRDDSFVLTRLEVSGEAIKRSGGKLVNTPEVQEKIKDLIRLAQEQGYLTYDDINDVLPHDIIKPEDYEEIMERLRGMQFDIIDASDVDSYSERQRMSDTGEEDETEKMEAKLDILDDPVRMYLKQMGLKELLSRQKEVEISRRIDQAEKSICIASALRRYSIAIRPTR